MKNWLQNFFSRNRGATAMGAPATTDEAQDALLQQKNEIQSLRIEQSENKRTVETLAQEIDRLRARQEQLVEINVTKRLEALFSDLAGPASQILTQADLLENQGKPVQARDILSVSRRMVRALERNGVVIEGKVGEAAVFNPDRHIPIQPGQTLQPGQPVIVRFAGVSYGDKMIYKAIVEQETACRED